MWPVSWVLYSLNLYGSISCLQMRPNLSPYKAGCNEADKETKAALNSPDNHADFTENT